MEPTFGLFNFSSSNPKYYTPKGTIIFQGLGIPKHFGNVVAVPCSTTTIHEHTGLIDLDKQWYSKADSLTTDDLPSNLGETAQRIKGHSCFTHPNGEELLLSFFAFGECLVQTLVFQNERFIFQRFGLTVELDISRIPMDQRFTLRCEWTPYRVYAKISWLEGEGLEEIYSGDGLSKKEAKEGNLPTPPEHAIAYEIEKEAHFEIPTFFPRTEIDSNEHLFLSEGEGWKSDCPKAYEEFEKNSRKTRKDLQTSLKLLKKAVNDYHDGFRETHHTVATELRKLLCDRDPLLTRVFPDLKLLKLHNPLDPDVLSESFLKKVEFFMPGSLSVQDGVARFELLFDKENIFLRIEDWIEQPFLTPYITIRELIKSVADKESVHSDRKANDPILRSKSIKYADDQDQKMASIVAIGEFLVNWMIDFDYIDL